MLKFQRLTLLSRINFSLISVEHERKLNNDFSHDACHTVKFLGQLL